MATVIPDLQMSQEQQDMLGLGVDEAVDRKPSEARRLPVNSIRGAEQPDSYIYQGK